MDEIYENELILMIDILKSYVEKFKNSELLLMQALFCMDGVIRAAVKNCKDSNGINIVFSACIYQIDNKNKLLPYMLGAGAICGICDVLGELHSKKLGIRTIESRKMAIVGLNLIREVINKWYESEYVMILAIQGVSSIAPIIQEMDSDYWEKALKVIAEIAQRQPTQKLVQETAALYDLTYSAQYIRGWPYGRIGKENVLYVSRDWKKE